MLRFREFLTEMSWDNYLYHMTNRKFDPKKIKPWSHFGSLHAAMGIGKNQSDSFHWPRGRKAAIHVYQFRPKGKGVEVYDEGGDTYEQMWDWLRELSKKKIIKVKKQRAPIWGDMEYEWENLYGELNVEKYLAKKLKEAGITHLYYTNRVEDPGSRSFVIINPKELKLVHTFKDPKHKELKYQNRNTKFKETLNRNPWSKRKKKFPVPSITTASAPYLAGMKKPRRKWSVKEAEMLRKRGWSYRQLARRYHVAQSTIWKALNP